MKTERQKNKPCVYCSLPEIKKRAIIENDLAWAFPTNIPITAGHILIAPKRCAQTLEQLSSEERLAILDLADKIILSLKKVYDAEGFNCVWNQEKLAGQSVPLLKNGCANTVFNIETLTKTL